MSLCMARFHCVSTINILIVMLMWFTTLSTYPSHTDMIVLLGAGILASPDVLHTVVTVIDGNAIYISCPCTACHM